MAQTQFVSLAKAWKSPEIYGDISKSFVDYSPTSDFILLTSMPDVSLHEDQIFETKKPSMGWTPWVRYTKSGDLYKIYFVATEPLETVCFGRNSKGWKNILENSRQIAETFESDKITSKGVFLTFPMYSAMPEHIKTRANNCWILKSHTAKVRQNADLYFVRNNCIETMATYYSYEGICTAWRNFLPIVEVPNNIMVKLGSSARNGKTIERSLRIALPNWTFTNLLRICKLCIFLAKGFSRFYLENPFCYLTK